MLFLEGQEPDIVLHLNDIGYTDASFVWDWDVPLPSMLTGKKKSLSAWTETFSILNMWYLTMCTASFSEAMCTRGYGLPCTMV